jgi:hypothetical protein
VGAPRVRAPAEHARPEGAGGAALRRAVLIALAALACATRTPPIDPGAVEDSLYRNEQLDLTVRLPAGWAFLSREEVEASARRASVQDPQVSDALAALGRTTSLFTMVDRAHEPAPGRARRAVTAFADTVKSPPAGVTSELFADQLVAALRKADLPVRIGARRQAIVGDRRFVVVATELEHDGIRGRLDHYLRYEPERLLVLTIAYPPEESAPPQAAIESIRPLSREESPR